MKKILLCSIVLLTCLSGYGQSQRTRSQLNAVWNTTAVPFKKVPDWTASFWNFQDDGTPAAWPTASTNTVSVNDTLFVKRNADGLYRKLTHTGFFNIVGGWAPNCTGSYQLLVNTNKYTFFADGSTGNCTETNAGTFSHTSTGLHTIASTSLTISGATIRFQNAGTPGAGKVLTSDANGYATWSTNAALSLTLAQVLANGRNADATGTILTSGGLGSIHVNNHQLYAGATLMMDWNDDMGQLSHSAGVTVDWIANKLYKDWTTVGTTTTSAAYSFKAEDVVFGRLLGVRNDGWVGIGPETSRFAAEMLLVQKNQDAITNMIVVNTNTGTNATARLGVNAGTGNDLAIGFNSSGYGTAGIYEQDGAFIVATNPSAGFNIGTSGAFPVSLWTTATERFTVASDGDISVASDTFNFAGTEGVKLPVAGTPGAMKVFKSDANGFGTWQNPNSFATLTDGANIAWDLFTGQTAKVTLGGNRTLDAPTNVVAGGRYVIVVIQDGTGTRTLTWNSAYKFPAGIDPTLTTTASAVDLFSFISYDGTNLYLESGSFDVK